MGYCMSYRRAIYRGGLLGDYQSGAHMPLLWRYDGADMRAVNLGAASVANLAMIAGDMRRVELDQRDERHLAAYATYAGITPSQAKLVLDALFDGLPPSDCLHMTAGQS